MKIIYCTLNRTLEELKITRNKLAVESKVRPNTINDLANNSTKAINFKTLESILKALEDIANEKGISRSFDIEDVFIYDKRDNN